MEAITKQVLVIDSGETGKVVRERRLAAGMTLEQLSEKTGIHPSQLSRLENGRDDWTQERFELVRKVMDGDGKAVAA